MGDDMIVQVRKDLSLHRNGHSRYRRYLQYSTISHPSEIIMVDVAKMNPLVFTVRFLHLIPPITVCSPSFELAN